MSANQSNLSLQQYGYDMVVATTQASINATMKQFLYQYEGTEFISCYMWQEGPEGSDDGSYVPGNYDEIKKIAGMDLFDIPNTSKQTPQQKAAAKKAYDAGFAFAFKATMGLPNLDKFAPETIPNVIVLDQGNSKVTYNLFFKEFKVLNVFERRGRVYWESMSQDTDTDIPWVFKFNVNLDMNTNNNENAFNSLPESVKRKVKNLCPDTMFSVQQLYLNLNTAGLADSPSISGLDPADEASIYLTRVFINSYFKYLKDHCKSSDNPDGNFILGYSLKPQTTPPQRSSIIPTDLNFLVSPNYDERGIPTKNYDLYTLNYLVMCDNHHMPAAVPFGWNWIESSEHGDYHGTMSIKKSVFASYINNLLSPELRSICIIPHCSVHCNFVKVEFGWGFKHETSPQNYQLVNDGTSKVLTFSYVQKSHDSDTFVPNWGNMSFDYSLQSDVYFEGNKIRMVTTSTAYLHVNGGWGIIVEGNVAKYVIESSYIISNDANGNLMVTSVPSAPQDKSDSLDPGIWAKIASLGFVDDLVSSMKSSIKSWLTGFLSGHEGRILSMLNGSNSWVFPGGKTFAFKDVAFSNACDLVTHVTYVEPK